MLCTGLPPIGSYYQGIPIAGPPNKFRCHTNSKRRGAAPQVTITYDPGIGDVVREERQLFERWIFLQRKGKRSGLEPVMNGDASMVSTLQSGDK